MSDTNEEAPAAPEYEPGTMLDFEGGDDRPACQVEVVGPGTGGSVTVTAGRGQGHWEVMPETLRPLRHQ